MVEKMFENGQKWTKWTKWSKTVANFNKNGRTDDQAKNMSEFIVVVFGSSGVTSDQEVVGSSHGLQREISV